MAPIQPMRHSGRTGAGPSESDYATQDHYTRGDIDVIYFALGCFWGAEEIFWNAPGVLSTAVGYMGGTTENPTYEEVCTGATGHAETVRVEYDNTATDVNDLLEVFWVSHDPTSLDRQGNDIGSQYRSAIFVINDTQLNEAIRTLNEYQEALDEHAMGKIVTEIVPASEASAFYYAEEEHQKYLQKNPNGYRCHSTTGIPFPTIESE